jgi:hypothetical protein
LECSDEYIRDEKDKKERGVITVVWKMSRLKKLKKLRVNKVNKYEYESERVKVGPKFQGCLGRQQTPTLH